MSSPVIAQEVERRPDRRVRKTRRALGDALMNLLTEKLYEDVTVQDIIDRADVSRSTFYMHFVDKDQLLLDAFRDLRGRYRKPATSNGRREAPFGWSFAEFEWALQLLREYEAQGGAPHPVGSLYECALAIREMENELKGVVREDLARMAGIGADRVPELVAGFVVRVFMCILEWWLTDPGRASPAEVDRQFRTLAMPGAAAALGVELPEKMPQFAQAVVRKR